MIRRLQNQIAESRWALPLTAIYGAAIVVLLGAVEQQMWAQTALLALSTLLMVELNNANALIRIYSRMVSCSFLVLSLMATYLFPSIEGGIVCAAFIAFYIFFLQAYQDKTAVSPIFTAFLTIGIASLYGSGLSSLSAFLSISLICMCCGQCVSHLPHPIHWLAKPGFPCRPTLRANSNLIGFFFPSMYIRFQ